MAEFFLERQLTSAERFHQIMAYRQIDKLGSFDQKLSGRAQASGSFYQAMPAASSQLLS